ncbi:PREDICTED: uncharacterized protein At2g38710-like isoform X2 [Nelumbo nucifera]|uniref:AMMECR1 domain-containing protein n=2 Tax=Nelumbo nucifera TaxID=4432 RepID=A0A822YHB3_NELNU|nr:PREDICTED: uncharacterized protein At2g38710-like isoform X2 [Nelumbo nucifera]DAD28858.1 TPA_asm: hypothetical protein HUJ06_030326 [Nelumbo nucifera]
MVSANQEMVVYCFDTLVAHYNSEEAPPPAFDAEQHALRDCRFPLIQPQELPYLECTVSILTNYETALNYLDWEIGTHGLTIEFTDPDYNVRRSATYLPEVAAHEGWTKVETIDSLMRKAGYNGIINESLRKRIRLTRYQSTIYTMHYNDYTSYVKRTRGAAPTVNRVKHN